MATTFKVGEEVYLKAGGPKMAVQKTIVSQGQTLFRCQWFAGKKLDSGDFPPESLVTEDPNPKVQLGS
jgi:uncharacterized protein YodC (DUF2158 family)